jgi:hypothetical protein
MLTAKAKPSATVKLGLATTMATLWMIAAPRGSCRRPNERSTRGGHSRMQRLGQPIFATRLG